MVKGRSNYVEALLAACRLIDILDEACHIFVRLMFIVGGKRNVKIGAIHIGLSDSIKAKSIIPGHIYQHGLTAIAGINHITCVAAVFRFVAPHPCAVNAGIVADKRKSSGIPGTDSGILVLTKHIVCFLKNVVSCLAYRNVRFIANGVVCYPTRYIVVYFSCLLSFFVIV